MKSFDEIYTTLSITYDNLGSIICLIDHQIQDGQCRDDLCVYSLALKSISAALSETISRLEDDPDFKT